MEIRLFQLFKYVFVNGIEEGLPRRILQRMWKCIHIGSGKWRREIYGIPGQKSIKTEINMYILQILMQIESVKDWSEYFRLKSFLWAIKHTDNIYYSNKYLFSLLIRPSNWNGVRKPLYCLVQQRIFTENRHRIVHFAYWFQQISNNCCFPFEPNGIWYCACVCVCFFLLI